MTEKLYLDATDRQCFTATVERALDERVVLDRTCFYPEGGGQPADEGLLEADGQQFRVTDVQQKDTVYHALETDDDGTLPPAEGTTVEGRLDWDRRYAHMRYHTAQHLLSAVLLDEFDARTVGNQLYADRARIDVAHDRFDETDLADIEAAVNERIDADLPVNWDVMDRTAAERELDPDRTRIGLLPDSITEVRIVEVGDYDRTACAGTHVTATGEIGEFSVTGRETKGSEKERVRFELAPPVNGRD
jgi:misacylated tRNA(Ala) deacylase